MFGTLFTPKDGGSYRIEGRYRMKEGVKCESLVLKHNLEMSLVILFFINSSSVYLFFISYIFLQDSLSIFGNKVGRGLLFFFI